METLLNLLILYGLEVAGLLVLLISLILSRSTVMLVVGGFLGAVLMIAHVALWILMAGIGSATSGSQRGYDLATQFALLSLLALGFYLPLAVFRRKKLRRAHI